MERGFPFTGEDIAQAGSDLVAATQRCLPRSVAAAGIAMEDWGLVGTSIIAKATGTLDSMLGLMPGHRVVDATILLRSLYEGVLVFGWVAIDPVSHLPRWIKKTAGEALKADNDWTLIGSPVLDEENRAYCEQKVGDQAVRYAPNAPDMAQQVDVHWSHTYPGIAKLSGEPADVVSFRGMYRHVYRSGSGETHYDLRTLKPFYTIKKSGEVHVHEEKTDRWELYPWLFGTYALALGLLIGSETVGWPAHEEIVAPLVAAKIANA